MGHDAEPRPPSGAWEVADPTRLGSFEIVGRLGRGAMGVVYEAIDPTTRRRVALKTISRMSPESVVRFKREFRTLARVQHANVVSLYELTLHDGQMFFTMELLPGVDLLRHVCGEPTALAPRVHEPARDYPRLRHAFAQLAAGVDAIHRAGLLHRDIKPSNVIVTTEGRVVLLDFGLVRTHDLDLDGSLTDDGAVLGTPLYMSPEQATGGRVGPPSDWYGVGAVLYQALTGRAPFQGVGALALLAAKRDEMPPRARTLNAEVPDDLDELCTALLSIDTSTRPGGERIRQLLGDVAPAVDAPPPGTWFLGRDDERDALRRAHEAPIAGRPVVVLVDGLSGVGKSALVQRFLDSVSLSRKTVVLQGKCSERESIPYKALDSVMDALADHLRRRGSAAEVRALLPRDAHAVARLFPVLLSVPAIALAPRGPAAACDASEARRRAFEGLRELLARLADECRLVLFIDDLQWSDHDSAALLDAILRHGDAPGLLLVATMRSGADEGEAPVARLVASLTAEGSLVDLRRIHLGPLSEAESTELARRMLGLRERRFARLAEEVAREAEGSPFFVGELVRYAWRSPDTEVVTLDGVLRARITGLPSADRTLLETIAVAGGRVALRVLAQADLGGASDPAVLARLRSEHLVRTHGPGETDSIEIYHDRIREAALREIDEERLPAIHLAIGRALQATGDNDAVALSHHFRQAGEDRIATKHTIAAAEQAAAALAFDRAAELYRTALELSAMSMSRVPEIEARLAESLANAGRLWESAQAYLRASRGAEDHASREWTRRAAEHLLWSGHGEEGRVVLEKVLRAHGMEVPASNARAIASILRHRVVLSLGGLRIRLRHAADIAPEELERVDACWTAARGLLYTDGIAAADFHARGLRASLRCGDPVRIARALGFEAQMMVAIGADPKLDRAQRLVARAAELAEKADSDIARGMVVSFRGHMWIGVGQWEASLNDLDAAVEIFRDRCTGVEQEAAFCRAHGAICLLFLGRIRDLATRAQELLVDSTERANPYVEGFARGLLGNVVLLAADRVADAQHQLALYRRDAPRRFQAHMLNHVAQSAALHRYLGDGPAAWALVEEHGPQLLGLPLFRSPHAGAELSLWRGASAVAAAEHAADPSALLQEAERAASRLRAHPSAFGRGYGELVQAAVSWQRRDSDAARAGLRQAVTIFNAYGMAAFAAAARRRLADLVQGEESVAARSESDAYYRAQGVVRPERFVDMNAPGFTRRRA